MEDRVPGGRQRSATMEDFTADDDDETPFANAKLTQEHRHVSQSLPKFNNNNSAADPKALTDDFTKTQTLDRQRKSRIKHSPSIKQSLGNFMHKMVRQVSQLSMGSASPKTNKKSRSHSVGPAERRKFSSMKTHNSFDASADRPSPNNTSNNQNGSKTPNPGTQGLRNHGNTCFMNAVLQCLSHTELLAEYFVSDQYRLDMKRNNKINAKRFGTKGELTEQLAVLMKSLWSGQYTPEISSDFKTVVGKYGCQYRGFAQHDAQEFLLFLLDKIHEDLNIATKKKYRANKSSQGRSDDAVAAEALANHMRCNNSFVYDLFQALYKSSLTCPNCRRQSNTFDPFLSVSLPIPQKTRRPIYVTVVYLDAHPKQVKIGLLMNQSDTIHDLRCTLASDTKIPTKQLILTEVDSEGFQRTFHDEEPLGDLQELELYAIETPQPLGETENTPPSPSNPNQFQTQFLTVLVINKQVTNAKGKRFGAPIVLQVPRDITYLDLQKDILHNMVHVLREGIIAQQLGVVFKLRVVEGLHEKCYLPYDVEHPLYMPTIDRALAANTPDRGPAHVKLIAEWDQQTKQCMVNTVEDNVEEHASVQQVDMAYQQPVLGTLDECFTLYTQEEKLGGDDAWLCPACKKRQQGATKTLSLWSLPDILVIHLKRFKQTNEEMGVRRTKLNTLITFPIQGLDMSQHATKRSHSNQHNSGWSPWRLSKHTGTSVNDYLYDLYAVCNHYGNMQGGHYTALCRNPANDKWYVFDDSQVKEISEDQTVTKAAYLLFYRRRSVGRTQQYNTRWIYNIANLEYRPRVSKSHEDLLEDDGMFDEGEEEEEEEQESTFQRRIPAYATMHTPSSSSKGLASSDDSSQHSSPARIPSSQSSGLIVSHTTPQHNPVATSNNRSPHALPPVTNGSTASTPDSPRHGPPPIRSATPTNIPLPPPSIHKLPSPISSKIGGSSTLTRSSSMSARSPSSQTHKGVVGHKPPAQRPTIMSGMGGVQALHRGVISPSTTSNRKLHGLSRSNSTAGSSPSTTMACQFVRPSAITNSHPSTPNSNVPRHGPMTRSSSMSSTSTTWSNTYCMKESCV